VLRSGFGCLTGPPTGKKLSSHGFAFFVRRFSRRHVSCCSAQVAPLLLQACVTISPVIAVLHGLECVLYGRSERLLLRRAVTKLCCVTYVYFDPFWTVWDVSPGE
jgi:hypothetical protein